MSTFTETLQQTFRVVTCYTCGIPFGITSELYKRAVTDACGSVHCPACGGLTCWQESEDKKRIRQLEEKLQWEAKEVARQIEARQALEVSLRATRGQITKLKNRAVAGVCPCCQRTFQQLSRHMKLKHPEFV